MANAFFSIETLPIFACFSAAVTSMVQLLNQRNVTFMNLNNDMCIKRSQMITNTIQREGNGGTHENCVLSSTSHFNFILPIFIDCLYFHFVTYIESLNK